ncbi:hypothetical protein AXG93_1535s1010 [Marchantia polymorpha subsp. ruderalis]|uniref:Uncharacterized protein n=1 Tax=Marchantia polymorpha subsp. ruderalis TaxID=1480154 RepID=A0A176VVC8_MARPO|nr:hypothetical protein AXG93_1535s1010 [Marchantia polymorpha subsp. ruderalis]
MEGSLGMLIKVRADAPAEPLKEGMEIVSPNSLSSERTRSARSEETPHPKTNEELVGGTVVDATHRALLSSPAKEVRPAEETKTSEEKPKVLVVSFPDFLQDSVVPLLKYLDGKREKYVVSKEVGFYVEMVRYRTQLKRALAVKRKWDSATELARERAANLATECAAVKATLQEREAQLREKKIECEVLQLNQEKEFGRCAKLKETCDGLRKSNENEQKMTTDLLTRLEKSREAYDEAVKQSELLITTAERREKKHIEELAALEAQRAE